ncbi:hypothetical protein [Actinophytocola sp. KF-1]
MVAHVMERARAALAAARETADRSGLAYVRAKDGDGHDTDGNAGRRALVLWAAQFDWQPADLALHRFLAEQEALCRGSAPFQGTSDEHELARYLLARHRLVDDVWRQWSLKMANFDTSFAYDIEAVCAAGPAATLAYVRSSGHEERDALLARFEQNLPADDDVERYFARKARWFPAAADPSVWDDRAETLEYLEAVR